MGTIVSNVLLYCGCDFREDRITHRMFYCFPSFTHDVIYHAQLHGTLNATVSELASHIEEWAFSADSVLIQLLTVTVVSFCIVPSSTPLELCPNEAIDITGPGFTLSNGVLVAIGIASVLLIGLVLGTVFTLVYIRKQRKAKKPELDKDMLRKMYEVYDSLQELSTVSYSFSYAGPNSSS